MALRGALQKSSRREPKGNITWAKIRRYLARVMGHKLLLYNRCVRYTLFCSKPRALLLGTDEKQHFYSRCNGRAR